ncbi:MAG: DUF6485 family protein [Patescibacteria group bacterium]|nr:DUF6485 family protein [Patescibacteria group bacterium]
MECRIKKNLQNCPCTYQGCELKGKCCECVAYHRANKELPACYFSTAEEKTYDRSIKNFINNL